MFCGPLGAIMEIGRSPGCSDRLLCLASNDHGDEEVCVSETSPTPEESGTTPANDIDNGDYDASAIQVLEGLEAVRKRPGMYIGSTGERGLHHLIWEVVDNAVDEALAGYCDRIVLTLLADGGVRVEDNGRGIPTDTAAGQELPALTMALTLLHAGGKFGGGGYKVSGGLHGVGISVVNALSTRLIAEVRNRGHEWRQTFTVGVPDGELEQVRDDGARRAHRHHDHLLRLRRHLRGARRTPWRRSPPGSARYAFLNKGLEIVIRDERPSAEEMVEAVHDGTVDNEVDASGADAIRKSEGGGLEQVFKYDRGLVDYVEHLNRRKDKAQPDGHQLRGRDGHRRQHHEPRARDAVEHLVHRVGAHLRQHDQHPRGRHPRGGLPRGAHHR